jgi:hypothetical protein
VAVGHAPRISHGTRARGREDRAGEHDLQQVLIRIN